MTVCSCHFRGDFCIRYEGHEGLCRTRRGLKFCGFHRCLPHADCRLTGVAS